MLQYFLSYLYSMFATANNIDINIDESNKLVITQIISLGSLIGIAHSVEVGYAAMCYMCTWSSVLLYYFRF